MTNVIETEVYEGYRINTVIDEFAENPFHMFDTLTRVASWHNRYMIDVDAERKFGTPEEFLEWVKTECVRTAPVYLYDHGNLRIKIGSFDGLLPQGHAQFDTMQIGWAYVTHDAVEKLGTPEEYIDRVMHAEIEELDAYLSGAVYGYEVLDRHGKVIDSCYGFYGHDSIKYGVEEARNVIDDYIVNSFADLLSAARA